jgi:HlyD family secretion protein
MQNNHNVEQNQREPKSFKTIGIIAAIVFIALIVIWLKVVRGGEDQASEYATFVAKRGPLTISVLESGTIQPQEQITLRNEVEGRTSIIRLVPDGAMVKKDDVLVELDASTLKDRIIDQDILVQKAHASFVDANENLAVIQNQARSDIELAQLTLKFAQQDLQQYLDGIYPKDVNEQEARIRLAEENLKRAEDVNDWSKRLYLEKYLSETEYLADKLSVQRNKLERDVAISDLDLLENYTYHRQIDQLTSDVNQAEMALERTERKASASVIQAEADLRAKELEYKRQQEKYNKTASQLEKTIIKAPMDGMVIYATTAGSGGRRGPFDRREPMDIGVEVSERQDLIALPTADAMKAQVDIHETNLEKIRIGLPAVITIDALAGKKFLGRIKSIAPLPDARSMWMNPDLKIYPTDIYLEDSDSSLRTGMSCKVEVIIAQYDDTVYVPVQSVLRVGGKHTVFVLKNGEIEERNVEVGLDDNNMIRIGSGLEEGEVVLMTPPLQAATLEPGSRTEGAGLLDSNDVSDTMKERVNQKLQEANGTGQGGPRQGPPGQGGPEGPADGDRERMRERFQNMTPEERQKEMERMRQRFENMSEEEREQMRQRFQGQGRGQGPGDGQRQGGGRRQGGGQRQGGGPGSGQRQGSGPGGGQRPRGSEGNP